MRKPTFVDYAAAPMKLTFADDEAPMKPSVIKSGVEGVDLAELPDVPEGYWDAVRAALPATQNERSRSGVTDDDGSDLDNLVTAALLTLKEVLDTQTPDRMDDNYTKILALKKDAAVSLIGAGLKADENRFRKRNSDILGKLFNELKLGESSGPVGPLLDARVVN